MAFNVASYVQQALAKGRKFVAPVAGKTLLWSREVFARDRWNRNRTAKRLDFDVMVPVAQSSVTGVMHKVTLHLTVTVPQQATPEELTAGLTEVKSFLQSKWLQESISNGQVIELTSANQGV